jgi:protein-arginine kinase activator protein McsA
MAWDQLLDTWRERLRLEREAEAAASAPSITCPQCRMTSYNATDIRQGYCGNCRDWTTPR